MKRSILLTTLSLLMLSTHAPAQKGIPMPDPLASLKRSEIQGLKDQATEFFTAAKPAITKAVKSTVAISYRNNRIAYGTVIAVSGSNKPAILTKWSEIRNARGKLVITAPDGKQYPAQATGIYPDHDLAILTIEANTKLTPLDLTAATSPQLGDFIALASPDGNVAGFGVVSVKARSLRESDKAYLGVMMDFASAGKGGVPLKQVMPDSAASKAGLRDGDIIVSVNQTKITGAMEMRNLLQRLVPGSKIIVSYRRGVVEKNATVNLGSRADNEDIRRFPRERMEKMQRMGAVPSLVRSNFPSVIQSDMPINPYDAGAPVADLDGNIVGITIARGSRIKTFIIPTKTIKKLLTTKPRSVNGALTHGNNSVGSRSTRRSGRNNANDESPTTPSKPPRAVPTSEDETMDRVKRLLDKTKRNNEENTDNLKKIEDALRELNKNKDKR